MSSAAACPFCNLPEARRWLDDEVGIAFLDGYPIAEGHTLVIPRRHVASVFELDPLEQSALWRLVGLRRGLGAG